MMPFNPDFGRVGLARDVFRLRFRHLKVDQPTFAARFGVTFGMVKGQKRARRRRPAAFKVLVAAIKLNPDLVERAAGIAAERWLEPA